MRKTLLVISILFTLIGATYADYSNDAKVFNEGVKAYNNGDYKSALKKWKSLIPDEDDPFSHFDFNSALGKPPVIKVPGTEARAEYEIGSLYEKGLGVLKSYTKAGKHYRESARWNYPQGQLAYAKLTLRVLRDDLIEGITKEDRINGYKEAAKFVSKLYENERATDEMHKEAEELWSEYELHKYPY